MVYPGPRIKCSRHSNEAQSPNLGTSERKRRELGMEAGQDGSSAIRGSLSGLADRRPPFASTGLPVANIPSWLAKAPSSVATRYAVLANTARRVSTTMRVLASIPPSVSNGPTPLARSPRSIANTPRSLSCARASLFLLLRGLPPVYRLLLLRPR